MDSHLAEPSQKPPSARRLAPWRLSYIEFGAFVSITLAAIVAGTMAGTSLGGLFLGEYEGEPPNLMVILATIGMQLGGLGAYLFFRNAFEKPERGDPLPFFQAVRVGFKWLIISYPAMIVVSYIFGYILESFGYPKETQEAIDMLLNSGSDPERWLMYASVVAVAPICEEFVFRGGVYRFLHGRLPLVAAATISGALFSLMHFNLYSFAPLTALGVGLALAYRESGSIVSAIALHAAFNLITTIILTLYPEAA